VHEARDTNGGLEMNRLTGFGLGFDVRIGTQWLPELWTPRRRSLFLLLPSVAAPLSIDPNVWPPFFEPLEDHPLKSERDPWHSVFVKPSSTRQKAWHLWDNYDDLAQAFLAKCTEPLNYWFVAYELCGSEDQIRRYPLIEQLRLDSVHLEKSDAWCFLGYDVFDGGMSGLLNTAYTEEDRTELEAPFANLINSNHLLTTLEGAEDFREACDIRSPEEAPYFVIALYRAPFAV